MALHVAPPFWLPLSLSRPLYLSFFLLFSFFFLFTFLFSFWENAPPIGLRHWSICINLLKMFTKLASMLVGYLKQQYINIGYSNILLHESFFSPSPVPQIAVSLAHSLITPQSLSWQIIVVLSVLMDWPCYLNVLVSWQHTM